MGKLDGLLGSWLQFGPDMAVPTGECELEKTEEKKAHTLSRSLFLSPISLSLPLSLCIYTCLHVSFFVKTKYKY